MPEILIPTGRWKVAVDPANAQGTIRLSGRALSDGWNAEQKLQTIYITHEQARELIAGLHTALRELDLQRSASLARAVEGDGIVDGWDYSLSGT
ncbi:hypothetical protein J8I87_38140 [Paraburkholderia sp. LEh10]|jgi:hypothetical protein|uniref:hypothetical protein n=1 Tax=Paraburkholderia sp. LEh10 TaxID=2821353 RepID=UPI001AE9A359|nr:hypothetical protein [Paraburkholderia sp. LEh10]MBP0595370.1 hypothetical protein [Paraburkholderia sp. LEh10]